MVVVLKLKKNSDLTFLQIMTQNGIQLFAAASTLILIKKKQTSRVLAINFLTEMSGFKA